MKTIQWFPGHMAKAMRMMEENLKVCDAVIFVLDARAPASTYNPRLRALVKDRPVLYLLNKGDLADGGAEVCAQRMRESGLQALRLSATGNRARELQAAMQMLVREKQQRMQEKGIRRPLRFLVAGVPNTGKSTVINLLCGARRAITGDKAGVTRAKQWVKCGSFELMDTPGTMPPSFTDQRLARRLAYIGCVNDDILALDEIALSLLEELYERCPKALEERYGIAGGTPLEMLDAVCARRGFVWKGKEYDYERGERAVIDDFRKGKLGRLCLDSPADLAAVGLCGEDNG